MNQIKKASEFFSSRRSVSVRNLKYPGPSENQIMDILKKGKTLEELNIELANLHKKELHDKKLDLEFLK